MTHHIRTLALITGAILLASSAKAEQPLSYEQAREMALEKIPGTVVDTERSVHNGAVVYEFDIRQDNGAVIDIEINSRTKEVHRLVVDQMGTGSSLPEPVLTEEQAREIAIKYIQDNTSGLRGVDVLSSEYKIVKGQLGYTFLLRRGISDYKLSVNANSGEVISFDEE
jgi:uncharacterized membrane protein YkoI